MTRHLFANCSDWLAGRSSIAALSAQSHMGIGHHTLGRYRELFRELGKRPSAAERKVRTAERHRLWLPTRIAVVTAVVGLSCLLLWAVFPSLFGH
jgi:hypothetical protein